MTVSFDQIPYAWRRKGVYAEIHPRYDTKGLYDYPTRVLIVGQRLATGSVAALTPKPITRTVEAAAFFGAGSQLAKMVAMYRQSDTVSELWAMGVADAAGAVKAVRTLTLTGAPTDSGTLALYVGGTRYSIGVSAADTVTSVAAEIAATLADDADCYFTATSAAGVVTLTAKNAGTCGSEVPIRLNRWADEATPAGLTVAIGQTTAGATDPALDAVVDAMANTWWTDLVMPWTDAAAIAAADAEARARFDAMVAMDLEVWCAKVATYAQAATWSSTKNSEFVVPIAVANPWQPSWEWAASLAAVGIRHLTDDPSRQLGTLVMTGIMAPADADCFTEEEQNLLLHKGLSTFDPVGDGTVALNRVVTLYQHTTSGVADDAWLDVMTIKTMMRIRWDWNAYVSSLWPRAKLQPDESPAVNDPDNSGTVVTPRTMLATWIARATQYRNAAWIQDLDWTKDQSSFEIHDADKNRLDGRQPVKVSGNLMVLAGRLEFAA